MPYWFPRASEENDPTWWRPLEAFAELVADRTDAPLVLPCEFMLMGRIDRRGRTGIWEYKHKMSRRYLQIDDTLVVYRYVPPADLDSCDGRYVRDRGGWRAALGRLELAQWARPRNPDDYCESCNALFARRAARLAGRAF